jgi:hypothetical protein
MCRGIKSNLCLRGPRSLSLPFVILIPLGASVPAFASEPPASPPPLVASQTTEKTTRWRQENGSSKNLSGEQKHDYEIPLTGGQYTSLTVEQRGIDMVAGLFGPDGRVNNDYDSVDRGRGQEDRSGLLRREKHFTAAHHCRGRAVRHDMAGEDAGSQDAKGKSERLARRVRSFSVDR